MDAIGLLRTQRKGPTSAWKDLFDGLKTASTVRLENPQHMLRE